MSLIAWIFLGLVSGFIANKLVTGSGAGLLLDVILGVIGAVVGGVTLHLIGEGGVTGFNLWSLFVSVFGAVLALVAYRAVSSGPQLTARSGSERRGHGWPRSR
jgi:uncharacterized membrane protein YeaQ/YmgE (transglycosylase-associated protein family)